MYQSIIYYLEGLLEEIILGTDGFSNMSVWEPILSLQSNFGNFLPHKFLLLISKMILYLSSALLVLASGVHTAFAYEEPYLAPHEERFFNALDNINKDFNAFMKIFAKNAYCEFSSGKDPDDVAVKSGHCRELVSNYETLDEFKARWYPLTNTDPKQPERGVFAHAYVNYGLSNNGCEDLFQGFAEVKASASV